ncbi:MAG: 30S ribosome-binding factor RbfA [Coriobacteriia bacterium]|nr:30S ribosome-binding factor RbfA [Coriobacteriia bacterium]
MKSTPRTRKLGETVREALAEVLRDDVADPRLDFVTITSVQVSSDLGVADVYVTTHGDQERYDELLEGMRSADKRIRAGLARRVSLRITPELRYHLDTSVDESMRIYEALKDVPPSLRDKGE